MKDDLGSDSLSRQSTLREPHTKEAFSRRRSQRSISFFFFFVHWAPGGTRVFGFECSG